MNIPSTSRTQFAPAQTTQDSNVNTQKQKAPAPASQAPMPAPTPDTLMPRDSIKQLQRQRIHSAFAATAQSEGSSNAIIQAKRTEQELLKRLEAGPSNSDKLNLEEGPLPGGWPRLGKKKNRVDTSPLNWQGLQSHSDNTNYKLIILVDAISQATGDRVGPHVTISDLNTNPRVMSTLREYVQTAEENHVQPHSLNHILDHLINN